MGTNASPELQGSWLEGRKLFFDALKHVATLATASVVLCATFYKDIALLRCPWLVGLGALLMTAAAALSWWVMIGVASAVSSPPTHVGSAERRIGSLFVLTVVIFTAGLLSMVAMMLTNLIR